MNLEPLLRFAAILDKNGERIAGGYRKNLSSKLSPDEVHISLNYAAKRHGTRTYFAHRIGKVEYSMTVYEKIKQLTIPINEDCLLLISTEKNADHEKIIAKILNLIQKESPQIDFHKYLKCSDCKAVEFFCPKHKLEVENFLS